MHEQPNRAERSKAADELLKETHKEVDAAIVKSHKVDNTIKHVTTNITTNTNNTDMTKIHDTNTHKNTPEIHKYMTKITK